MTVKNIAEQAAIYLGAFDILALPAFADSEYHGAFSKQETGQDTESKLAMLVKCINFALNEIAAEHFNLIKTEKVEAIVQKLSWAVFDEKVLKVKSVKKGRRHLSFKELPDGLESEEAGVLTVEYCYLPPEYTLQQSIEVFKRLTVRLIAYAAVSEYYFMTGLFSEAEAFRVRFLQAVKDIKRPCREIQLPRRRFI